MSLTWAASIFRGEKVSEHHSGSNPTLTNSSDQRHSLLVYVKQFIITERVSQLWIVGDKSLFQTKRHSRLGMKWALIQSSQVELVPLKQWLHILQSEPSKTKEIRKTSLLFKPTLGSPGGTMVNNLPSNAGYTRDTGSIPGLGRSPGVGNGNPLQYSCLENSMDRGVWQATVYGVANKGTQLSMHMGTRAHAYTHTHTHTHTHFTHNGQSHCFGQASGRQFSSSSGPPCSHATVPCGWSRLNILPESHLPHIFMRWSRPFTLKLLPD